MELLLEDWRGRGIFQDLFRIYGTELKGVSGHVKYVLSHDPDETDPEEFDECVNTLIDAAYMVDKGWRHFLFMYGGALYTYREDEDLSEAFAW